MTEHEEHPMSELGRRLEELAARGEPRGAARVWADATTGPAPAGGWRRQPAVAFLALLAVAALVGSVVASRGDGSPGSAPSLIAASRLDSFDSCGSLLAHLKREALERVGPFGLAGGGIAVPTDARSTAASSPPSVAAGEAKEATDSTDFSGTNVQEAGVDEPDVVKTDGRVVYALAGGRLWAVDERGTPKALGSIAMETGTQLLLAGDRLLVLGDGASTPEAADTRSLSTSVTLTVVDVRTPGAMKVTSTAEVDGQYVSARLVDGVARVVVRSPGPDLAFVYPSSGSEAATARALAANREVIASSTIDDWLPSYRSGSEARNRPAYDCARTYAPREFAGFGLLTVLTVDPADPRLEDSTSVVADGQTVYASTDHLYVATNRWSGSVGTGVAPAIGRSEPAPLPRPVEPSSVHTLVHEFDIRGTGPARYLVSGEVRGTVLGQFSMSELDGDLRVATTDAGTSGTESFVTVLTDDGATLRQVGQVGGLGRGEQIRGVRFLGDRGYVVTFRQSDPLYVVDLSDPTAPRVAGELKVLGYSAYLHPLEGNLLLGVGVDATEQGRVTGFQVSLFDVADPADPKRLQQLAIPGASSTATFDHHAFLYWPATGLTVIPIQPDGRDPAGAGSYALGLRITRGGVTTVGQVHQPAPGSTRGPAAVIERSLVIGDRLVTFSAGGLLSSDLATLSPGTWVPFS